MAYIREMTCISASLDFNFDATQSQLGNAEISDAILVHWDVHSGQNRHLLVVLTYSFCSALSVYVT